VRETLSTEGFDAIIICDPQLLMWIGWAGRAADWVHPPLPILIPDVIFWEATDGEHLGSNPLSPTMVKEWAWAYADDIRIIPTAAGAVIDMIWSDSPEEPTRMEAAAWEVIDDLIVETPGRRAILCYATGALRFPWPDIPCEPLSQAAFLSLFITDRAIRTGTSGLKLDDRPAAPFQRA
jgi:hypothetical protein